MVNHAWSAKRIEIRKHEATHAETCQGTRDCLLKGYRMWTQTLIRDFDFEVHCCGFILAIIQQDPIVLACALCIFFFFFFTVTPFPGY